MRRSQQIQKEKGKVKRGPPRGSISLWRLYDIGAKDQGMKALIPRYYMEQWVVGMLFLFISISLFFGTWLYGYVV